MAFMADKSFSTVIAMVTLSRKKKFLRSPTGQTTVDF